MEGQACPAFPAASVGGLVGSLRFRRGPKSGPPPDEQERRAPSPVLQLQHTVTGARVSWLELCQRVAVAGSRACVCTYGCSLSSGRVPVCMQCPNCAAAVAVRSDPDFAPCGKIRVHAHQRGTGVAVNSTRRLHHTRRVGISVLAADRPWAASLNAAT